VVELVIQYESDGADQQQRDAGHDELVGHHAPRHAGEHPAGGRDVVVGAVQRVPRVRDRLPLPVQVLQDADAQLLRAVPDDSSRRRIRRRVGNKPMHACQAPGVMGRLSRTAQAADDALLFPLSPPLISKLLAQMLLLLLLLWGLTHCDQNRLPHLAQDAL